MDQKAMIEFTNKLARKIKDDVRKFINENDPIVTSYDISGTHVDYDGLSDYVNDLMNDVAVRLVEEILGDIEG